MSDSPTFSSPIDGVNKNTLAMMGALNPQDIAIALFFLSGRFDLLKPKHSASKKRDLTPF